MAGSEAPAVSMREVWKVFRTGSDVVRALKAVSFELETGTLVCLRGASGSGKTTLLNILGGLDPPTAGEVTVLGRPYAGMSSDEAGRFRRTHVGFMLPDLKLVPHLTALENVFLPRLFERISRQHLEADARNLLERVGLSHRSAHQPRELSMGERQRVAFARAIVNRPKILLVDEPTANLDEVSARGVLGLLTELCEKDNTTIVVATHDDRVERVATRVLRLDDGQLTGSLEETAPKA